MSIKVNVTASSDLIARAEAAAQEASKAVMVELYGAFQESFDAKAWNWPRDLPTRGLSGATLAEKLANYRKGKGKRAGNPRNLIDLGGSGGLRSTGVHRMTGPYRATFTWSAEYATAVHEGALIYPWGSLKRARNRGASKRRMIGPVRPPRRVQLPARPWTRAVLGQEIVSGITPFPIQRRLKDAWLAYFKAGR